MLEGLVTSTLGWALSHVYTPAKTPLHPEVAVHALAVRLYPGLAESISTFATAFDLPPAKVTTLMAYIAHIAALDASNHRGAQWRMSRLIDQAEAVLNQTCREYDALKSDDAFRTALWVSEDVLPDIRKHLENILHNHLLQQHDVA